MNTLESYSLSKFISKCNWENYVTVLNDPVLDSFFQFPNYLKQESKVDVQSYVLMSVMLPYAIVISLILCLWKPHNAKSVCKYNQFYRLQGKIRQNCVKESAISFPTCRKVDVFVIQ